MRELAVQAVLQQTMGRVEAELAGLDADVLECDASAARLHRELAKARERCSPGPSQLERQIMDQAPGSSATAVVSRRTNGTHLPSLGGVKAGEVPEGFLFESAEVEEGAVAPVAAKQRGNNPGLDLCPPRHCCSTLNNHGNTIIDQLQLVLLGLRGAMTTIDGPLQGCMPC